MKANSKKLLSLLVVVAMVLAMTPVITLPASAASPSEWITGNEANNIGFSEGQTLPTTCPFCSGTVTWMEITGDQTAQITGTPTARNHLYFSGTVNVTGVNYFVFAQQASTVCVYLMDGATVNQKTASSNVFRTGSSCTINIFGGGTVISEGSNMFNNGGTGTINIYGGTYTQSNTTSIFNANGKITLYGGTFNQDPRNFSNVTIAAGYEVEASSGKYTVKLPAGAAPPPETPAEKMAAVEEWQTTGDGSKEFTGTGTVEDAFCPCCWDNIDKWEPLTADTVPTSGHYYLATDISTNVTGNDYALVGGTSTMCLYLNGKDLTVNGRLQPRGTVNLIGGVDAEGNSGTYTRANTGTTSLEMFYSTLATGSLNIYGGNYVNLLKTPIIKIGNASAKINIYGGTFTGETLFLDETSNASGEIAIYEAEIDIKAMNNYKNHNVIGMAVLNGHDSKWFMNEEAVVTYAAGKNEIITPYGTDMAMTLNGETVRVDCNGNTVTVKGTGTVNGFDSADLGTYNSAGGWVLDSGITIRRQTTDRGGNTYVTLDTSNPATGSRTAKSYNYKLDMTTVTLKTSKAGLYFKTTLETSQELASKVRAYGVVLGRTGMPKSTWVTDGGAVASCVNTNTGLTLKGNSLTFNSCALVNILNENPGELTNAMRAEVDVYANGYLLFDYDCDGSIEDETQYIMAVADGGEDVVYDMNSVMEAINDKWNDEGVFTADTKATAQDFYNKWNNLGAGWDLSNIATYDRNAVAA